MAKSMRSKGKRRDRAVMRGTVGLTQATKNLRKVTRRNLQSLIPVLASSSVIGLVEGGSTSTAAAVAGAEAARALLSGVAGAAARLVTAAPARKRALRYTFNSTLREARMGAGLEDETDDEAVADGAVAVGGGYAEQGVDSSANADDVMGGGGGGGGGAGAQPTETTAIEEAGRKKAPGKPVPKRGMGPRFREWEDKDAAQPLTAGLFVSAFDGRRALRPATARAPGRTTLHTAVGGGGNVFARLAREEK